MTHLREEEVVDLIEGQLSAERSRHAEACASCRSQAEMLGAVLRTVRVDDVPEPSPLFWEHLSARVAERIDAGPAPARDWTGWLSAGRMRVAIAAVALVLIAGITWRTLLPGGPQVTEQTVEESAVDTEKIEADAWELVEAAADDLDLDDLHALGINVRPDSADRMVLELTEQERLELARLLEDEMKRTGA